MIECIGDKVFKFNGKKYIGDKIIFWDGDIFDRKVEGTHHNIYNTDEETILNKKPDILVIATGLIGKLQVTEKAKKLAKKVITGKTPEMIKEFNNLLKNKERVGILLHTTC